MLDFNTADVQWSFKSGSVESGGPSLLIISNCSILRRGLGIALRGWPFRVVDAVTVEDADKINAFDWDALLFDVPFDADIDQAFRKLALLQSVPCIILSEIFSLDVYAASLRYGAAGYLLMDTPLPVLQSALFLVLEGKSVFPKPLALAQLPDLVLDGLGSSPRPLESQPRYRKLSEQQRKILAFLAQGDSNKIIARRLQCSDKTVKVHMKAIFRKLGLQNRTQAAVWAVRNGDRHGARRPFCA